MYDDNTTRSFAVRKDYGRRVGTVKDVKHQNKVFKPLKFKHLNI